MKLEKLFFGLMIFYSCNQSSSSKNYVEIEKNIQGQILSKTPYYISNKDTFVNGTVIQYFIDGKVKDSFTVKNGDKEGYLTEYYSTGQIKGIHQFQKNKLSGISLIYFPNGKLEIEELFRSDSILYLKNFYSTGELKSFAIMKDRNHPCYFLVIDSLRNIITNSGDSNSCKNW